MPQQNCEVLSLKMAFYVLLVISNLMKDSALNSL
jgi:hypothetical protein